MKTLKYARILAFLAAVAACGCRNPFDPEADVRILWFEGNAGHMTQIVRASITTLLGTKDAPEKLVAVEIENLSTPSVTFTSYTVVYRQASARTSPTALLPDSPIPELGGAAGRRFHLVAYLNGVTSANSSNYHTTANYALQVISEELLQYINAHAETVNGGIDCVITLQGSDESGHDVSVSNVLHVEIM